MTYHASISFQNVSDCFDVSSKASQMGFIDSQLKIDICSSTALKANSLIAKTSFGKRNLTSHDFCGNMTSFSRCRTYPALSFSYQFEGSILSAWYTSQRKRISCKRVVMPWCRATVLKTVVKNMKFPCTFMLLKRLCNLTATEKASQRL